MSERRVMSVTPGMPARLDAVVRAAIPTASRRLVRALIEDGSVRVNGRRAAKGRRVAIGDLVEVPEVGPLAPEPDLPLRVLYEDPDVIAIDKPGGVPGHALDPRQRGTIAGALLARYPELDGLGGAAGAGLVHRLDTGTSGVLLAARSSSAYTHLREAFRDHDVVKRYAVIVDGVPEVGTAIDVPLAHDRADRRRMRAARPDERAWPARTTVVAVDRYGSRALVRVEIRSGVTHQVRVHLALAGCPVVGDVLYGGTIGSLPPERHALHAEILEIPGRRLRIVAPFPEDLRALLPVD